MKGGNIKTEIKEIIKEKLLKYSLAFVGGLLIVIIPAMSFRGETNIYKQNETAKFNDVEYKIIKVEKLPYDLDEDYDQLKVTIKISNTGKSTVKYNDFNFSIANKNNEDIAKNGLFYDDGTYLDSGSLDPGKSVEGAVSCLIKKDAKDLRIRYYENLLSKANEYAFQWAIDN